MSSQIEHALARLGPPSLVDVRRHALFLDLDGTLLEIRQRPDLVASDQALRTMLQELGELLGGALAIVSGRTIDDVDAILNNAAPCVVGLHGQELRIGARRFPSTISKEMLAALATVRKLTAGGVLEVLVENKGAAIALHYRRAPEQAEFVCRIVDEIAKIHGLKVLHGKMVAELVPTDATKARAISALIHDPPFAGRTPIAVGDDATDEEAFEAAVALGGFAVHVGPPRPTSANYRVRDAEAVIAWLLAALQRTSP
jgi:trehalose 6-phosphate phosphatase